MELGEVSQEAQYNDSSFSSRTANQLSNESHSFYNSSLPDSSLVEQDRFADDEQRDEDYEWEKFVKEEERKYGKPATVPKAN